MKTINQRGNPDISLEAERWRQQTPNWKQILAQHSKKSTGPKSYCGKLKVSMNARKWFGTAGRFSKDSLFIQCIRDGYFLSVAQSFGDERMEEIIKGLMDRL